MKAYVLINVRAGTARAVCRQLQRIKEVKSAYPCWGRPDVFAFVEAKNEKALAESVLEQIQTVDGVKSTDTHIVIE